MRILQINKFYFLKGGAERYLFGITETLRRHGHEVIPFAMSHPDNVATPWSKYFVSYVDLRKFDKPLKTAARIIWSKEASQKLSRLIKDAKPEVAHLHNIAHQLSPSILHTLKKHGIPMVQTLHDYKLISLNYNLFNVNQGKICQICASSGGTVPLGTVPLKGFFHRCLNSWSEQLLLALEQLIHKVLRSYSLVGHFIAPSQFMKNICVSHGVPEKNSTVLPYLLDVSSYLPQPKPGAYFLFFGRLSKEKGLDTLLEAMKELPDIQLKIVGTGPEEDNLKFKAQFREVEPPSEIRPPHIEFLGYKTGEELKKIIVNAQAVVVPSLWYENSPLVIYEAFALGKPVIASSIGGIPELVRLGENGFLFQPGDSEDLKEKITHYHRLSEEEKIQMGKAARAFAEEYFDPEKHYEKLMEIYERIQDNKKTR